MLNSLKKALIERALSAEMDIHLGYEKSQSAREDNYRNGVASKAVITEDDKIVIYCPQIYYFQSTEKNQKAGNNYFYHSSN